MTSKEGSKGTVEKVVGKGSKRGSTRGAFFGTEEDRITPVIVSGATKRARVQVRILLPSFAVGSVIEFLTMDFFCLLN